ncbi:MAG TPA: hypothetical protein VFV02_12160 [Acidimicrobiales bacterium]|nr:hypothetical protein [Acidimicrobiales bacterium]
MLELTCPDRMAPPHGHIGAAGGFEQVSDDELVALALADDPDQGVAADAIPLALYSRGSSLDLPMAYMPPVMARAARGWRVPVALTVVVSLLVIEAFGLCITYGILVAA